MKKLIFVLPLLIILLVGCTGLEITEYDPLTEQNVQMSMDNLLEMYEILHASLDDGPVKNTLNVLYDSETTRLYQWLLYEKSKSLIEIVQ